MQILLQNRTRFYEVLLPRIPDPGICERLTAIFDDAQAVNAAVPILDKSNINIEKLIVLDPFCKPDLGRKWGRTAISLEEALGRASRFEELIILAGKTQLEEKPELTLEALVASAQRRFANLLSLIDDLRYHRIRLVEMP